MVMLNQVGVSSIFITQEKHLSNTTKGSGNFGGFHEVSEGLSEFQEFPGSLWGFRGVYVGLKGI